MAQQSSWIFDLAWSKISSTPTTIGWYGVTGGVLSGTGGSGFIAFPTQSSEPSIGGGAALNNAAVSPFDFTNSNRLVGALGSQTSMPSSVTMSGLSNTTVMYAPFLY